MSEYFLIAKIDSVYGKNGFVKIFSYSDFPGRFFDLEEVYIDFFDEKKIFHIEKTEIKKNSITLKFKNFDDDKDVQILIGKNIFVDIQNVVKLPENFYFIHDLIGCTVVQNSSVFGIVKDVLTIPANSVYVVEDVNGQEILIPAVEHFIDAVDIEKKLITLKPDVELYDDEN